MGGNCCGCKKSKPNKSPPLALITNLQVDQQVLYTDSRYFKPKQQAFYNNLLLEEGLLPEIPPPTHWEAAEIIGQGSFGRVLFGRNPRTKDLFAIKEIPLLGISNLPAVAEEVQILSQLSHPHIVRFLGSQVTPECLLIFMEYMSGGTIHSLISKYGCFSENLIQHYTYQVLKGLEYLHYHNIVHRDIKSTNILISSEGTCKLADFGSAKNLLGIDVTSSVTGTINWMAPEVVKETGHGRHADIWGVGCLVIEMATSKPPWSHIPNAIELFLKLCNTEEVPSLPKGFSEEANDFVKLCFNRKPWERPNVFELLQHPFINGHLNADYFKTDSTRYQTEGPV